MPQFPLSDPAARERVVASLLEKWPQYLSEHHKHPEMTHWWGDSSEHDLPGTPVAPMPDPEAVRADLEYLAASHEDAVADIESDRVVVGFKTERIRLQSDHGREFDLGPFRVFAGFSFGYRRNEPEHEYWAEALDPNHPTDNDDITHPHVDAGTVCLGQGNSILHAALDRAAFSDALDVMDAVLHTYNSDSPYRSLESWDGYPCSNCGGHADDEDDISRCPSCDEDVCPECDTRSCERCGDNYHYGCLETTCAGCGDRYCSDCLQYCEGPGEDYCRGCCDRCRGCRLYFPNDDLDDDYRCPDCSSRGECSDCGEECDRDQLENGVCPTCRLSDCQECGTELPRDELTDGMCQDCRGECAVCGTATPKTELDEYGRCDHCDATSPDDEPDPDEEAADEAAEVTA